MYNIRATFSEVFKGLNFKLIIKSFKNLYLNFKYEIAEIVKKVRNLFQTNLDTGLLHYHQGYYSEALFRFKFMNFLWKDVAAVHFNLGRCYFMRLDTAKAKTLFEKSLALEPEDSELQQYFINKIESLKTINYSPVKLKLEHYNYYYDTAVKSSSVYKKYSEDIYEKVEDFIFNLEFLDDALELGPEFGKFSTILKEDFPDLKIDGVDISEKMIKHCGGLNIVFNSKKIPVYDSLVCKEMHFFLAESTKVYDLIIIIDTFNDFGNLSVIFSQLKKSLQPQGLIVIVLNLSDSENVKFSPYKDYFVFPENYLRDMIQKAELKISFIEKVQSPNFAGNLNKVVITLVHDENTKKEEVLENAESLIDPEHHKFKN